MNKEIFLGSSIENESFPNEYTIIPMRDDNTTPAIKNDRTIFVSLLSSGSDNPITKGNISNGSFIFSSRRPKLRSDVFNIQMMWTRYIPQNSKINILSFFNSVSLLVPPSAIQTNTIAIMKNVSSQTDNGIKKAIAERVPIKYFRRICLLNILQE
jgi:hypothetical protein